MTARISESDGTSTSHQQSVHTRERKEKDIKYLQSWKNNLKTYRKLWKKELYLVDEKEMLEGRQTSSGSLNPKEAASLEAIKESLTGIISGVWKASQSFVELYHQQVPES